MENRLLSRRKIKVISLKIMEYLSAITITLISALILLYIFIKGAPQITLNFLITKPSMLRENIGILPNILNTIYLIIIALSLVLPLGIGAAIYLVEYSKNKKLVSIIEFANETLVAIPSIIYGLSGMLIFAQFFSLGTSLMAGGLTLLMMILPIVIRTTGESLRSVPNSLREGAQALGAHKWYAIRTLILPTALEGVASACILSVGKIVGESAALLFTAGMSNEIMNFFQALKPKSSGSSLTVALYMYAKERGDFDTAFAIALILILLTLIINFSLIFISKLLKK